MSVKIFVSHATVDEVLASELIECLTTSLQLGTDDIHSTAVPAYRLPAGPDSATYLKELPHAVIVVGLLTPKALASTHMLFELGTAWGAGKQLFSVLGWNLPPAQLTGPLLALDVFHLGDKKGLTQLIDKLRHILGVSIQSAERTQAAIRRLIDYHEKITAGAALPKPIDAQSVSGAAPACAPVSDADAKNNLLSWFENQLSEQERRSSITYSKVDAELKLPAGTAKRLLKDVVSEHYEPRRDGDDTILLKPKPVPRLDYEMANLGRGFR